MSQNSILRCEESDHVHVGVSWCLILYLTGQSLPILLALAAHISHFNQKSYFLFLILHHFHEIFIRVMLLWSFSIELNNISFMAFNNDCACVVLLSFSFVLLGWQRTSRSSWTQWISRLTGNIYSIKLLVRWGHKRLSICEKVHVYVLYNVILLFYNSLKKITGSTTFILLLPFTVSFQSFVLRWISVAHVIAACHSSPSTVCVSLYFHYKLTERNMSPSFLAHFPLLYLYFTVWGRSCFFLSVSIRAWSWLLGCSAALLKAKPGF